MTTFWREVENIALPAQSAYRKSGRVTLSLRPHLGGETGAASSWKQTSISSGASPA
jgi:hypothetical protein